MDKRLLDVLVCPVCKGKIYLQEISVGQHVLVCKADRLAYPIKNGIPVMLSDEARALSLDELDAVK